MVSTKKATQKVLLAVLLSLLIIFSSLLIITAVNTSSNEETVYADAVYTGIGSGTKDDPYFVYTAEELRQLKDLQKSDAPLYAQMMSDIDLGGSSNPWTPYIFKGVFDGNGYTISGLYVNWPTTSGVGLFTELTSLYNKPSKIKDLTVRGEVIGKTSVGGIVGRMTYYEHYTDDITACEISNCRSYVKVTGEYLVGGIAGSASAYCDICYCGNEGDVTATSKNSNSGAFAGGIVGSTSSYVRVSYNAGTIKAEDEEAKYVGGIIGYSDRTSVNEEGFDGIPYVTHNYGDVIGGTSNVGPIQGGRKSDLIPSGTNFYRSNCGGSYTNDSTPIAPDKYNDKSSFASYAWNFTDSNEETGWGYWDMGENYPVIKPFEKLWVLGKNVNPLSYITSMGVNDMGWKYYKATNTLVFSTADLETDKLDAFIDCQLDDLNIILEMDTDWYQLKQTTQNPVYGIYAKGNLNIWQRYKEYTTYYGNIEIYLNKNTTKVAKAPSCYGIYCGGNLTIGSGYIDVDSGIATSADGQSTGIYAKSVTVNRGTLAASGYFGTDENHLGKSFGIVTENGVKVNGGTYGVFGVGMDKGIIGSFATELEGSKYESYSSISSKIASNSESRYNSVREPYMLKNLTDSTKVEIGNYAALTEDAVAVAVDELDITTVNGFTSNVKAINPNSITYPESKDTVEELQDAYNDLTSLQKKMVPDDVIDKYQNIIDHYIADMTIDFINEIDNVSLQPEDVEKIKKAKDLYVNLTPNQKELIPDNVQDTMDDILEEYYELIVEDITNKVNDIGEVKYDDTTKQKIDIAKDAYNALTDDEKAAIPQNIKDKLEQAYNTYEDMEVDATRNKIKDDDTGVSVETEGKGIPKNVELRVEVKTQVNQQENKADEEELKKAIGANQTIVKIFDVKLIQTIDGEEKEIQPSDIKDGMKIKIHMQIPAGINTKGLAVLHIHGDGSVDMINDVVLRDGEIIVEVTSLSEFAIVVTKGSGHGFCVGWVLFILGIFEMLFLALYVILRYGFLKDLVGKCKLDSLYEKLNLLTLIGVAVSVVLFIFALIALCVHQCALTIIFFILMLLMALAFIYFYLDDLSIIDQMKPKCKEYFDKCKGLFYKNKVKDEPVNKDIQDEPVVIEKPMQEPKKEETKKAEDLKKNEIKPESIVKEGLSLKESFAIAQNTKSSHKFTKASIAKYLKTKKNVEVFERDSLTSTGLPLADTHYVEKDGKKYCFTYVYETEGSAIILAKMDEILANEIKKNHNQVNLSAFPKQKDTWYSLIIDDSYSKEEVEGILDTLTGEEKKDAGMSLKESIALAKSAHTSHKFTKAYVCEFLKGRENIESNTRENKTSTGLPLADTHYVDKKTKKICFAYIYEIDGNMVLLAKMNNEYAKKLRQKHKNVNLSAFPKQKDTWYSLIIDDSYSKEEFEEIINNVIDQA